MKAPTEGTTLEAADGTRWYVEEVTHVEDEDGSFLAVVVPETEKDDPDAIPIELDPEQWNDFCVVNHIVIRS